MGTLPPLRTTRTAGQTNGHSATPAAAPTSPKSYAGTLVVPGLLQPFRALLQELLDLPVVELPAVKDFLAGSFDRLPGLTTRERGADALVSAGLLTGYQRDRVIAGNTYGLVLGAYRVLDRIGGGSSAVVLLGEHVLLRRRVAIKALPADESVSPELIERFRSEMRALASLDHPNVVTAFDAGVLPASGSSKTLHYLVLELVTGGDVERYVCVNGPQPVARACEWGRQVAAGLQAAHQRDLIHRDLKPSNLLLTADLQIKVVDFGLARRLSSSLTRTRSLVGSVDFMAPEQSLDPTSVGPAADVYGLGATLFWIITGQLPIPRQLSVAEMVKSLASAQPRRVHEFCTEVPLALDVLINRMLARDPTDRPSTSEVMAELAQM